ncbi:MAG: hypothetical protein LBT98_02090 [Puniceicoccales bacterium]|jgi:hypothetical protein|nr:hypothetical protein [Puniceicoccales bacterium]
MSDRRDHHGGVHLNGVVDSHVLLPGDGQAAEGKVSFPTLHACHWPLLILPAAAKKRGREMAVCGRDAEQSLVGSGLFETAVCRDSSRRLEVQKLCQDYGEMAAPLEVAKLLAQHLRSLVPPDRWARGDWTIAIPDSWKDLHQEALLRALSPKPRLQLLWNSVAAFLGEVSAGTDHLRWHGKRIVVLHGTLRGMAPVVLQAECVERNGRSYLVPTRSGGGSFIPFAFGDLAALLAASASTAWDRERLLRRHLRRLPGPAQPPIAGDLWRRLRLDLQKMANLLAAEKADGVILSGPFFRLCWNGGSTAEEFQAMLKKIALPRLERRCPSFDGVALGAALYGRYLASGICTYFDLVPCLEINAIRKWRPAFIPLAKERKIEGDKAYESPPLGGFKIGRGESRLIYYLHQGNGEHVRKTTTILPRTVARDVEVSLRVVQRPAQGFARVTVEAQRTDAGENAIPRRGFRCELNWQSMEDTGKTREEILEELCGECGSAFPPCNPIRPAPGGNPQLQSFSMDDCARIRGELRKKSLQPADGKGNRFYESPVGSDGKSSPENQPWLDDFLQKSEKIFRLRKARPAENGEKDLFGCWSYCYAAAPEEFLEHMRRRFEDFLADPHTSTGRCENYAGRCFHRLDDMYLFFRSFEARLRLDIAGTNNWMIAFVNLFQFRENAQRAMELRQAECFARYFLQIFHGEMKKGTIRMRFMSALRAFAALLRYRLEREDFLIAGDDPIRRDVHGALGEVLSGGYSVKAFRRTTIEDMMEFLECRGKNSLFFQSSEEEEGEEA